MGLNKSQGNMYDFVTHTWNTVKGACPHGCSYCYMRAMARRFNKPQCPAYFDESELKTNLGSGNFIFVGSSNDLFAADVPKEWIKKTLERCEKYDNRYLLQSKNPMRILRSIYEREISQKFVVCTTIETNRYYSGVMGSCPHPEQRADYTGIISEMVDTFVTVEPIMDFDLPEMVELVKLCRPKQVNIGADSGRNGLPEPPKEKVLELISALEEFTIVKQKTNLKRILKQQ